MTVIVSQRTVQKWLWMKERGLVTVRCVFSRGFPNLQHCKIMSYFRSDTWKEDLQLKEDLQKYVGQSFKERKF